MFRKLFFGILVRLLKFRNWFPFSWSMGKFVECHAFQTKMNPIRIRQSTIGLTVCLGAAICSKCPGFDLMLEKLIFDPTVLSWWLVTGRVCCSQTPEWAVFCLCSRIYGLRSRILCVGQLKTGPPTFQLQIREDY